MKELTIEEKAKRYDEVVNEIKNLRDMLLKEGVINKDGVICDNFNRIFPELKESEDKKPNGAIVMEDFNEGNGFYKVNLAYLNKEQVEDIENIIKRWNAQKYDEEAIRDCIGVILTDASEQRFVDFNTSLKDCLAWLEKQCEQKTEDKYVYTKFRVGDVIVEIKPNGYCQPVRVKYVGEGAYSCESDDRKRSLSFPIINQDKYKLVEQKPVEWHREDEQNLNVCLGYIPDEYLRRWLTNIIHVKYDKSAEWSEEDEKMFDYALNMIEWYGCVDKDKSKPVSDWLKSLKERVQFQNTWKPSESDIRILEQVIDGTANPINYHATLHAILEKLKKLREK